MKKSAWTFAIVALAVAACSPKAPEEPAGPPPPPPMRIEALNSVQLAEIVTANAPGALCANLLDLRNHGAVTAAATGPHAEHVGAYAYSVFCRHRDLEQDASAYGQQWMVWVTAVDPVQATVAPCFPEGGDYQYNSICWDKGPNPAPPAPAP
jgi:hypothetical protein